MLWALKWALNVVFLRHAKSIKSKIFEHYVWHPTWTYTRRRPEFPGRNVVSIKRLLENEELCCCTVTLLTPFQKDSGPTAIKWTCARARRPIRLPSEARETLRRESARPCTCKPFRTAAAPARDHDLLGPGSSSVVRRRQAAHQLQLHFFLRSIDLAHQLRASDSHRFLSCSASPGNSFCVLLKEVIIGSAEALPILCVSDFCE